MISLLYSLKKTFVIIIIKFIYQEVSNVCRVKLNKIKKIYNLSSWIFTKHQRIRTKIIEKILKVFANNEYQADVSNWQLA